MKRLPRSVPNWLRLELAQCPQAGAGVHSWIYRMARQLHWHYDDKDELADLLEDAVNGCGRSVPRREIEAAVNDSERAAWKPDSAIEQAEQTEHENADAGGEHRHADTTTRSEAKPQGEANDEARPANHLASSRQLATSGFGLSRIPQDLEAIECVVLDGPRLVDLRPASPFDCSIADDGKRMTRLLLQALFPGDPLLCCGWSQSEFDTRLLSDWEDLWTMQFVVPNTMTKYWGRTKAGHLSAHALDNTGPRRFLVIECDFSTTSTSSNRTTRPSTARPGMASTTRSSIAIPSTTRPSVTRATTADLVERLASRNISIGDICAAVISHVATFLPLVLVVASGGKSLHGWFYCSGRAEAELLEFMRYAVQLGADWRTWLPSQFVRMPDGTRDNGKRQTVHYFDPRPLWKPDCADAFLAQVVQACREQA
jgi:hypothetical protein